MAEKRLAVELCELKFPVSLAPDKCNFRVTLDFRYFNGRNQPQEDCFVLPGLEDYWENDPGRAERGDCVRGDDAAADGGPLGWMDAARVDPWERTVLLAVGELHTIRLTLYDVDRRGLWEKVHDKFRTVLENVAGRVSDQLPRMFGLSTAVERLLVEKMAAGENARDRILFRRSVRVISLGGTPPAEVLVGGDGTPGRRGENRYEIRLSLTEI
ncbi:MAG: hypothetical protein JXQ27_15010 [Acidobacteria bacterium]|nr:hypothetical protein [Acidobacteriota bacterium]